MNVHQVMTHSGFNITRPLWRRKTNHPTRRIIFFPQLNRWWIHWANRQLVKSEVQHRMYKRQFPIRRLRPAWPPGRTKKRLGKSHRVTKRKIRHLCLIISSQWGLKTFIRRSLSYLPPHPLKACERSNGWTTVLSQLRENAIEFVIPWVGRIWNWTGPTFPENENGEFWWHKFGHRRQSGTHKPTFAFMESGGCLCPASWSVHPPTTMPTKPFGDPIVLTAMLRALDSKQRFTRILQVDGPDRPGGKQGLAKRFNPFSSKQILGPASCWLFPAEPYALNGVEVQVKLWPSHPAYTHGSRQASKIQGVSLKPCWKSVSLNYVSLAHAETLALSLPSILLRDDIKTFNISGSFNFRAGDLYQGPFLPADTWLVKSEPTTAATSSTLTTSFMPTAFLQLCT